MSGCHGLYGLAALHSGKSRQNALNEYQGRSLSAPLLITGACVTCSQVGFGQLFLSSLVNMSVGSWMQSPPQAHQSCGWCLPLVHISRNKTQTNSETRKTWKQIFVAQRRYPRSTICVCVCVWDGLMFSSSTWYTVPSALLTVWTGSMATFLSVWDI